MTTKSRDPNDERKLEGVSRDSADLGFYAAIALSDRSAHSASHMDPTKVELKHVVRTIMSWMYMNWSVVSFVWSKGT